MRTGRLRWLVPGLLGLAAFYLGGQIEVDSINADRGFAYESVGPADAAAVLLVVLAVDQYCRWRRARTRPAPADWRMPAWQGYGCITVGAMFVALAVATWFFTELKSLTLFVAFVSFGALSAVLGIAVVRAATTTNVHS